MVCTGWSTAKDGSPANPYVFLAILPKTDRGLCSMRWDCKLQLFQRLKNCSDLVSEQFYSSPIVRLYIGKGCFYYLLTNNLPVSC